MSQKFKSIWDALEETPAQAENMKLRSSLMMAISEYVKKSKLTQKEVAKQMGTTQPRLNDVIKGRIEKCTVDRLVNMLATVGYKVEVSVLKVA